MSESKKSKPGRKRPCRLWGVDALALSFVVIAALVVRVALAGSGSAQAWAVFVAAIAAALGLGLLMRYAPARQVAMLMFGMVLVVEGIVSFSTGQLSLAQADTGGASWAMASAPPAAAFVRLGLTALFLCYLARPKVAASFRR